MQKATNQRERTNVIQVSTRRDRRFFLYLSKVILKEFKSIELHALGEAISTGVNVAEQLSRLGYVTIQKIETLTFSSEQKGRDDRSFNRKKVKMIIVLQRANDFEKLMENFKPAPRN
eukprot:TRINITY_DN1164_c0_g1_i1.p1 TRINITY_DN1164_c0_g1~~TRINITY_DN1164_c0_g1_i1.p1  ORF type:complete len:117 (-),score=41.75 TRINITY_DN1164_c0_g1_i1:142-492(-)